MISAEQNDASETPSELNAIKSSVELLLCFAFLICVHIIIARKVLGVSNLLSDKFEWMKWVGVSGIGTVAVWFACSSRTLWQRWIRFSIAVFLVYWLSLNQFYGFELPIGKRDPAQIESIMNRARNLSSRPRSLFPGSSRPSNTALSRSIVRTLFQYVNWTLVYWLLGATFSASVIRMLIGLQLIAPNCPRRRKSSIWNLFILVLVAAVTSHLVRGDGWSVRLSYLSNGATHAVLGCACVFLVFEKKWAWRFGVPMAVFWSIVLMDIAGGGLLRMWSRQVVSRMLYTATFILGLSVSPLATFALLKAYGYRAEHAWTKKV